MARLTDRQEKFVQELVKYKSQREAYRIAYPKCKSSDKTVDEMASRLFNSAKVYARYNKLHDRLIKETEDECIMTAKEVLKELEHMAKDDVKNYLSFRTEKTVVGNDGDGNPIAAYDTIVDLKNSDEIDTRNISEISKGRDGQFKFKLYGKDKALELLGKHHGIFIEKVEISKATNETIEEIEKYVNANDSGTEKIHRPPIE